MNTNKSKLLILFTILIIGTTLSACDFTSKIKIGEVRMGMFGDNADGLMHYSYRTFSGVENDRIQAEKDQIIVFSYQVTVEKGILIIEWQDPQGEVVWQDNFESDTRGIVNIPVEITGTYTIIIQGNDTGGGFQISWEVE